MIQSVYHLGAALEVHIVAEPRWLVLIHQIPPKPDYLRVKIGRDLRRLGAVAIKNSVYVVPTSPAMRAALAGAAREIRRRGGEAAVCEAAFVEGLTDGGIEDLFRAAVEVEYAPIALAARRLAQALLKGKPRDGTRPRAAALELGRLKRRFAEVVARDRFEAPGRQQAAGLLSLAEDRLQGVDRSADALRDGEPAKRPHGVVWVTRAGIMVDRISSAWLIRRFIDPAARFRFVPGRAHAKKPGQLRFDMASAEFTHEGDRCTFEVLTDRFALRDPALKPIAEIVHDIDLGDARYRRPETAGVESLIVGFAVAGASDKTRLVQGSAMFDNLYESFRRKRR